MSTASPMPCLYTPGSDIQGDHYSLESEITFLHTLIDTLPRDKHYQNSRAHYETHINSLNKQLAQVLPQSPAASSVTTPGSAATPGSAMDWTDISRKRPRGLFMPGTRSVQKRSQVDGDVVDLTEDEPVRRSSLNSVSSITSNNTQQLAYWSPQEEGSPLWSLHQCNLSVLQSTYVRISAELENQKDFVAVVKDFKDEVIRLRLWGKEVDANAMLVVERSKELRSVVTVLLLEIAFVLLNRNFTRTHIKVCMLNMAGACIRPHPNGRSHDHRRLRDLHDNVRKIADVEIDKVRHDVPDAGSASPDLSLLGLEELILDLRCYTSTLMDLVPVIEHTKQLAQVLPQSPAASSVTTPGSASIPDSAISWTNISRKPPRRLFMPGTRSVQKRSQVGGDVVDLTEDDPVSPPANQPVQYQGNYPVSRKPPGVTPGSVPQYPAQNQVSYPVDAYGQQVDQNGYGIGQYSTGVNSQNGFRMASNGFGVNPPFQNGFGGNQNGYGLAQNSYGVNQNGFGVNRSPYSVHPNYHSNEDTFSKLQNTFQPQPIQAPSQPADAFVPDPMDIDQLAAFINTPVPASYPYNQRVAPQANSSSFNIPIRQPNATSRERRLFSLDSPSPDGEAEQVNALIEGIKFQDEDNVPRMKTPKEMSCTLMPHQQQGLAFLVKMENGKNKGCVLADEMGLGKTIEGLSLIVANPSTNPAKKTTLIVAPVALMRQWEKEIERHIKPAHKLRVHVYHQNGTNADFSKLRDYDVVLTTFSTLAAEQKRIDTRKVTEANDRERRDPTYKRPIKEKLGLLGDDCIWYRVILDEAQNIKNRNTLTSKAASNLKAQFRLCMTGTPMQNSVEEFYPLIRFLHATAYQNWHTFNDHIWKPIKAEKGSNVRERGFLKVQALIKSITLRREKNTIVDGKPIVNLPPKHINIRSVQFSEDEQKLYRAVETNSQATLNKYLAKGTVNNNYANILVMLLRLRQLCCHPHLIKDLGVQVSTEGISEDVLKNRAEMLEEDVVRRLKELDVDGFECRICYETDMNPTIAMCGHTCCGECFQQLMKSPQSNNNDNDNNGPKCPVCRTSISSECITDYHHFCKVFCPEKYAELRRTIAEAGGDTNKASDDDSDDSNEYSDDEGDEDASDPTLGGFIDDEDEESKMPKRRGNASSNTGASAVAGRSKGKGSGKDRARMKHLSLADLKKLSLRSAEAKARYIRRLQKKFKTSAKIEETMRLVEAIRQNDRTEKTLIFSSFTTLLDLIEVPLANKGYRYQRYDGSIKFEDRVEAVNEFMDKSTENIMLISIKAGNAGLNLNKASQVIMLDSFWNPFVEDQAVDHAHRMPQKREVHVHRVLVPETVEDRIVKLQDKKRDIINAALDKRASKQLTKLSVNELCGLFGL